MSEVKLLHCPFCGGEARLQKMSHKRGYYVICKKCGCKTPYFQHQYSAKEILQGEAISRWNTRKPMERIVKNLEHLCEQTYYKAFDGNRMAGARNNAYHNAIQVVKEEGGIHEEN